jgi:hypothetical protein
MVSDWNRLKYFACFCTVIIRCTETFWSSCINITLRRVRATTIAVEKQEVSHILFV